jgi:hypothetical protein
VTTTTLAANLRSTLQQVTVDVGDYVRARRHTVELETEAERRAVEDLRRDGYAVIENFWTQERAFAMRDRLEAELEAGESKDYDSGAYLRFWDNRAYDEGVRRLYHVERVVPELEELRHDPVTHRVAEAYYGIPFHSGTLVFQHNTQSNANTRTYHVDWWGKEFKSFLYLDDVDEGNGPFTYLRGTHKSHLTRLKKQLFPNREGGVTTFFPEDLGPLKDREVQICGRAGTLILADVRGFHRGSPQLERKRSVIVNYMFPTPGDRDPDR